MNRTITVMLLAALTALLLVAASAGALRLTVVLPIVIAMNFVTYCIEGSLILWLNSAREIEEPHAAPLHRLVRELTTRLAMPMPKLYLIPQETSNIFALARGPRQAAVAVTTGLLRVVDRRELASKFTPELAHIRHRDALFTTIAVPIAAAISVIANCLFWAALLGGDSVGERQDGKRLGYLFGTVLAPILAIVIRQAICRSREGARIAGTPNQLAPAAGAVEVIRRELPIGTGDGGERVRR